MIKESDAILLRIYIDESDKYEGIPLSKYLLEYFKKNGLAEATILRDSDGFGKPLHTKSILRLSDDLPIVVEVVDRKENIERIKPILVNVIEEGMMTEEEVKIILYESSSSEVIAI